MTESKVIPFTGISRIDQPIDRILEDAKGNLNDVVIIGYDKNDEEYFASSIADGGTVNWLLDRCKKQLLEQGET